jgi:hypothetical protein
MAVNRVDYGGNTLIDLTGDTVTADTLASGATAHDKSGAQIIGTAAITATHSITLSTSEPSGGSEGDVWLVGSGGKASTEVGIELSTTFSTSSSGGSLENIIDGNTSTYWQTSSRSSSGTKYVLFTLSEAVTLTSFECYSASSSYRPTTTETLQVSSDGSSWTTAGTFASQATNTFTGTWENVKYIRIYSTRSSRLYINECTLGYTATEIWDYEFTKLYQKTASGWAEIDNLDTLKSGAWKF